jgi:hypothetical protein
MSLEQEFGAGCAVGTVRLGWVTDTVRQHQPILVPASLA